MFSIRFLKPCLFVALVFPVIAHAASGDLLWRLPVGSAIWGDIKVDGQIAYFGSDDGNLNAVDIQGRQLVWQFHTKGRVRSAPAFKGQLLYFSSDDGYLYCLDKTTGQLHWKLDLGDGEAPRNLPGNEAPWDFDWGKSSPVVQGNRVFIGSANGYLYAVNAKNGDLLWRFQAQDRVRATPVVQGNVVYLSSWDTHVYAVTAAKGELLWKRPTGGRVVSAPALIDGKVIVGSRDARLHAWSAKTGEPAWTHVYTDGSWVESSAVPGEQRGTFFIGSSDAFKLSKFDAASGKELWSFRTTGWTWGTPTVANGTVYIGSTGADVYWQTVKRGFFAVDTITGQLRWSYQPAEAEGYVHGGVHAAPAVKDGQVFVGDLDGHLYVFEE